MGNVSRLPIGVGGTEVDVGGTAVGVGGTEVDVGGTEVDVGGTEVGSGFRVLHATNNAVVDSKDNFKNSLLVIPSNLEEEIRKTPNDSSEDPRFLSVCELCVELSGFVDMIRCFPPKNPMIMTYNYNEAP